MNLKQHFHNERSYFAFIIAANLLTKETDHKGNEDSIDLLQWARRRRADPVDAYQISLDGWVDYFMALEARPNSESHNAPRP